MLSLIIPLLNEEENLEILYHRLLQALKKLGLPYEIIFIDDGSTDNSLSILRRLTKKDNHLRIFSFRRNIGKAEALTLGMQKAKGEFIVTLDSDLQDRPEEIEKLYKKAREGYDLVSGWRRNRKDSFTMILASKFFNLITKLLWGLRLHDYNCGLKVYSKELAKNLQLYGGMHRFIPLLAFQQGFSVTEIEVNHDKRLRGKSKYSFSKIGTDLPDLFTVFFLNRFSRRPFHFFFFTGNLLLFIGLIFLCYLTYLHYFLHKSVGTRPLLSVGILLILVGLQIIFTGVLSDLIIHLTSKGQNEAIEQRYIRFSTDKNKNLKE